MFGRPSAAGVLVDGIPFAPLRSPQPPAPQAMSAMSAAPAIRIRTCALLRLTADSTTTSREVDSASIEAISSRSCRESEPHRSRATLASECFESLRKTLRQPLGRGDEGRRLDHVQVLTDLGEFEEPLYLTRTRGHAEGDAGRLGGVGELDQDSHAGAVHELKLLEVHQNVFCRAQRSRKLLGELWRRVQVEFAGDPYNGPASSGSKVNVEVRGQGSRRLDARTRVPG